MVESWTDTLGNRWQPADVSSYARSSHKATTCSLNPDPGEEKKHMDLRRSGIDAKLQRAERPVAAVRAASVDEFVDF